MAYFVVLAPSLRVSGATARAVGHAEGPPAACRSRADCLPRSLELRPARESLPERARELHPGGFRRNGQRPRRAVGGGKQSLAAGRQGPGRRPPVSLRLSLPALEAVSLRRRLAAFRLWDL